MIKINYLPKTIKAHLKKNKLNHAYLFYGPGRRRTITYNLSKIILCRSRKKPCRGECCRNFAKGRQPDFILVKKEDNRTRILIHQIRELIRRLAFKSPGWRVVVMERADLLGEDAANAFLKTLEEPAAKTVFILTARNLKQVLPTIASRCQNIYLVEKNPKIQSRDREKKIFDFLEGDLVNRFKISAEVAKVKDEPQKFIEGIETVLRSEMIEKTDLLLSKKIASEIKLVTGLRLLLNRNVSARLILEDLSLRLKKKKSISNSD